MKKRIISVMMIMALIVVSAIPVFAEETKVNKEEHKVENRVMGKITSINENYLTIDVATPKRKENNDINKSADIKDKPENRNIDDMFTLTGEKKTINISKAKFMGQVRIMNENKKDSSNNTNNSTNQDNSTDVKNQEKDKELTYKDFAVGDYAQVVLADDGSAVAKVVIKGGLFRNRPEGKPGNKPDKKPNDNNKA